MDNWDEMRTAFQVARLGTVSGAAEVLGVHHATVIRHIDALEGRLGIKLFQRLTREVVLTAEGAQLLPSVSGGFKALEQGVALLTDDPAPHQLNISTLPSFASRWLVPRLGRPARGDVRPGGPRRLN